MRSTFKILFYLKKNAPKKNGCVPLMARITVDGQQAQFSCKIDVDPKSWDISSGKATGRSEHSRGINDYIEKMRTSIRNHYNEIQERDNFVTAEKVKNAFLGINAPCTTFLKIYEQHNKDFQKEVDAKLKSDSTFEKYQAVYKHLKEFLSHEYNLSDISLKEITSDFITDFEIYLRTIKKCSHNTVWIYMMPLRRMIRIAIKKRWLYYDPFIDYEILMKETHRSFLTKDELMQIAQIEFCKRKNSQMELVRDLFIFCSFTGLSYCDMKSLNMDDIVTGTDGCQWIIKQRGKTGVFSVVKLIDIPLKIIAKYKDANKGNYILPVPEYGNCRKYLVNIAKMSKINRLISWHISRHTFATEVCLTNGVTIESLSRMLGHKDIRTTQIYAKITNEKISNDVDILSKNMENIEQFKVIANNKEREA